MLEEQLALTNEPAKTSINGTAYVEMTMKKSVPGW